MSAIIWVHEDALRGDHLVRAAAGEDARAVFIWDEAYFRAQSYSAKRLIFITECLSDMKVSVYTGETQDVLKKLARGADIYTASTPNPDFRAVIHALNIIPIADEPLARLKTTPDMTRFFRYWNKAKKSVMSLHGLGA